MSKQVRFEVFVENVVLAEDRVIWSMVFAEDVSVVNMGRSILRWEIFEAPNREEMKNYEQCKEEVATVAQPLPESLVKATYPTPQLWNT